MTTPTDEARLHHHTDERGASGGSRIDRPCYESHADEARAGEPRPDPVEQLADFILGKIESPEYQGLHPELASMGLAIAISERAAAAPALDVERLADDVRYGGEVRADYWRGFNEGIDALVARLSEKAP